MQLSNEEEMHLKLIIVNCDVHTIYDSSRQRRKKIAHHQLCPDELMQRKVEKEKVYCILMEDMQQQEELCAR